MNVLKKSFGYALPIIVSYLSISIAYGLLCAQAGMSAFSGVLSSVLIYTGAFQFVMVPLIAAHAGALSVALTCFFMNIRMFFYGLSFTKDFRNTGLRIPYMIHSLTDETYAVYLKIRRENDYQVPDLMFGTGVMSQVSWILGTWIGVMLGSVIPFDLTGIEFIMTAMFLTIICDQWEHSDDHFVTLSSFACGIVTLLILGKQKFMLAGIILAIILMVLRERRGVHE